MTEFNLNHEIIIYPTAKGWVKIIDILKDKYALDYHSLERHLEFHRMADGGYKEQAWVFANLFGCMLYNGQTYISPVIKIPVDRDEEQMWHDIQERERDNASPDKFTSFLWDGNKYVEFKTAAELLTYLKDKE